MDSKIIGEVEVASEIEVAVLEVEGLLPVAQFRMDLAVVEEVPIQTIVVVVEVMIISIKFRFFSVAVFAKWTINLLYTILIIWHI